METCRVEISYNIWSHVPAGKLLFLYYVSDGILIFLIDS